MKKVMIVVPKEEEVVEPKEVALVLNHLYIKRYDARLFVVNSTHDGYDGAHVDASLNFTDYRIHVESRTEDDIIDLGVFSSIDKVSQSDDYSKISVSYKNGKKGVFKVLEPKLTTTITEILDAQPCPIGRDWLLDMFGSNGTKPIKIAALKKAMKACKAPKVWFAWFKNHIELVKAE